MNLTTVKSFGKKVLYKVSAKSPLICAVGAGISIFTTATLASRATLRSKDIIPEAKEQLAECKKCIGRPHENKKGVICEYSKKDFNHDRIIIYSTTVRKIIWNYLPAAVSAACGVACVCGVYGILGKRLALTSAALNAEILRNKKYRQIVREEVGEEKEIEMYKKADEETAKELNDKRPSKAKLPESVRTFTFKINSETSSEYVKNKTYMTTRVANTEKLFDDQLDRDLYVTALQVCDYFGLKLTDEERKALHRFGWSKKLNPESFISFGDWRQPADDYSPFADENERSYQITLNVDGDISDYV